MKSALVIAIRNLLGEKGRLLISAGGVAFSVTLILILLGLYFGWQLQMTRFLGSVPADLWVGQPGSGDLSHSISILSINTQDELEQIEGVDRAVPFSGRRGGVEINGNEVALYLIGLEEGGLVKPYAMEEGKGIPSNGEIIIDESLATNQDLALGDEIEMFDRIFKIVGISSGGNILAFTYAFVSLDDLNELMEFEQFTNYFMIQTDDPVGVTARIEDQFPNMQAFEKEVFLDRNAELIRETFLPIIAVLVVIAISVGTAVIGLTIFTATIEKSREYGVLKAMGYLNHQIFSIAAIQSFASGVVGFAAGNILSPLVAQLAGMYTGGFVYELGLREIAWVGSMTLLMIILAVLLPLRRIISIDPAAVFKA